MLKRCCFLEFRVEMRMSDDFVVGMGKIIEQAFCVTYEEKQCHHQVHLAKVDFGERKRGFYVYD